MIMNGETMPEPIAPPQIEQETQLVAAPVVPPAAVSPAAQAKAPSDSPDKGLQDVTILGEAIRNGDSVTASDLINKKINEDKEGHLNTHTQWGGVVASILGRDYMGAWKYYNGGPTRLEEGRTGSGEQVFKEYNANGYTGRMLNAKEQPLSKQERLAIEERGGVVTNSDQNAIRGGAFQSESQIAIAARTGLALPVVEAMKKSYETSQVSSQANNKIGQTIDRLKKSPILDIITKLTPEQRKDVFGFAQTMGTTSKGETTAAGENKGGSATVTKGGTVNLGGEGAAGKKGGVTGGGSAGVGASDTRQGTASQSTSAETGTSASNAQQNIENMITKIQKYTQGAIKSEDELNAVRAFLQDSLVINQVNSSLNAKDRAPGVIAVPEFALGMTSRKEAISNGYDMQRNNALDSAWSAFTAKKVRDGGELDIQAAREEFMNTNTFRGINNKYDALKKANETGKDHVPTDGFIDVGPNNRPRVWKDGKPEYLNVR